MRLVTLQTLNSAVEIPRDHLDAIVVIRRISCRFWVVLR